VENIKGDNKNLSQKMTRIRMVGIEREGRSSTKTASKQGSKEAKVRNWELRGSSFNVWFRVRIEWVISSKDRLLSYHMPWAIRFKPR